MTGLRSGRRETEGGRRSFGSDGKQGDDRSIDVKGKKLSAVSSADF
jgi:hypothetical protein